MGRTELNELEERIIRLEALNNLLNRTNPAIALGVDLHDLGNVTAVSIIDTASQSISTGTSWTLLTLDEHEYGDEALSDLSNTRISIVEDGLYMIGSTAVWTSNSTGTRGLLVQDAGGNVITRDLKLAAGSTRSTGHSISTMIKMNPTTNSDHAWVAAYVLQTSGGNLNVQAVTGSNQDAQRLYVIKMGNIGGL